MTTKPNKKEDKAEAARKEQEQIDYLAGLRNRLETAYREADRIVVSASIGALALSVVFVTGSDKNLSCLCAIRIAWVSFLAAIALVLVSLVIEQNDKKRRIKNKGYDYPNSKKFQFWQDFLNKLSLTFFGIGCLGILIFLWNNL